MKDEVIGLLPHSEMVTVLVLFLSSPQLLVVLGDSEQLVLELVHDVACAYASFSCAFQELVQVLVIQ